jgi:hypothetical protein
MVAIVTDGSRWEGEASKTIVDGDKPRYVEVSSLKTQSKLDASDDSHKEKAGQLEHGAEAKQPKHEPIMGENNHIK